jgi:soluble lytic murein transglycosylase-like protein
VDETPPSDAELRASGRARVKPKAPERQARTTSKPAGKKKDKSRDWWERSNDAPPDEIDKAARLYNIPAELIRAVIAVESAGNASALSQKGAVGLMQLMPSTAGRMYVVDPVDPRQNIQGGTRYLRTLANQFNGDMVLVLAAYNAGPEAVRKFGGVPPFAETRDYVRKVVSKFNEYKQQATRRGQLASAERPHQSETRP